MDKHTSSAPDKLARAVLQYVRQHYRPPARLRRLGLSQLHGPRLAELSARFTSERDERRGGYLQDPRSRAAYLLYYLPISAATATAAIGLAGGIDSSRQAPLRLLDIGAGPLSGSIGAAMVAGDRALDVTAVDSCAAILDDGAAVLKSLHPDVQVKVRRADLRDRRSRRHFGEGHDLILVANVLNEFKRSREREFPQVIDLVEDLLTRLNDNGVLLIYEPGTRSAFDRVLAVREHFVPTGKVEVIAPCLGCIKCPLCEQRQRDWCHVDQPWQQPKHVAELDEFIGHRRTRLKFTYLALSKMAPQTKPGPDDWRVIGGPMRQKGVFRRYLCGIDGRVVGRAREANLPGQHPLRVAWRGDLVSLRGDLSVVKRGRAEENTLDIAHTPKRRRGEDDR